MVVFQFIYCSSKFGQSFSTVIIPVNFLEAISKMQITFKDKAWADEKAQSRQQRDEQYILRRSATP
jgi:hypothetical protein